MWHKLSGLLGALGSLASIIVVDHPAAVVLAMFAGGWAVIVAIQVAVRYWRRDRLRYYLHANPTAGLACFPSFPRALEIQPLLLHRDEQEIARRSGLPRFVVRHVLANRSAVLRPDLIPRVELALDLPPNYCAKGRYGRKICRARIQFYKESHSASAVLLKDAAALSSAELESLVCEIENTIVQDIRQHGGGQ
ncbi:MAG: hypothetical protein K8T90_15640 [Planctomycetes bacterium]|nr:hypothetical protein [Planctomycetota bacterium]